MTALSDQQLYDTLLSISIIERKTLDDAASAATKENIKLEEYLLEHDLISDSNLGKLVADTLKKSFIELSNVSISDNILKIIPEEFARKHKIIAFRKTKNNIDVATTNPDNKEIIDNVSKKIGNKVNVFYATPRDIEEGLLLYKKEIKSTLDILLNDPNAKKLKKAAEQQIPTEKIVNTLIEYAYDKKASDIHIEPREKKSMVRFRIDGVLQDILEITPEVHEQIINKVKVESKLRTDEHLSAQDGKMTIKLQNEELDIRVSLVPVVTGENCVLRLLSSRSRQFGLTDIGIKEKDLIKIQDAIKKPYGMILSTGPTGSGKTTTIYSLLKILNTRKVNIATIEDPVEYSVEGIQQIQVNNKTNLTFAEGLRSILRQDPDIIYVGEVRDKETAGISINSAMTGHLVLSTLHTNTAATAIPRLLDLGVEPFLVATTVSLLIGQRLVRQVCDSCKTSYTISAKVLEKNLAAPLIKKTWKNNKNITLYKGKGCAVCNGTGYTGRLGIFEILEVTENIRKLINTNTSADIIQKQAIKNGMTTMLEDGLEKVAIGLTTVEEILRVTRE